MKISLETATPFLPGMDPLGDLNGQVRLTSKMLEGLTPEAKRTIRGLLNPEDGANKKRQKRIEDQFDIAFSDVWTSRNYDRLNTFIEAYTFLVHRRHKTGNYFIAAGLQTDVDRWEATICAYDYLNQAYNARKRKQSEFAEVDDARNAEFYAIVHRNLVRIKFDRKGPTKTFRNSNSLNLSIWAARKIAERELAQRQVNLAAALHL